MSISISAMAASDLLALQELFLTVRKSSFAWLPAAVYKLTDFEEQTKGEYVLVAKSDIEIIGFIAVWQPESFIHHLFIKTGYQGRGIGTALLNEVKKMPGVSTLTLKCLQQNAAAIQFYKRNGFTATATGVSAEGEYIVMECQGCKV